MPAKPSNPNIVRDRTLVLRILVPGLHTRLNDKINNLQESIGSATTPTGQGGNKIDQILNLDGVSCLPSGSGSTLWHFRCDGATYPARLVNLPCPVEVHKTVDHATYHKSADIGQMLLVYEDEYAMSEAVAENKPVEGFPSYYHSGLTPPMRRVVKRRFASRMEERDVKAIPPKRGDVCEVESEIKMLIEKLSDKKGPKAKAKPTPKNRVVEEIEEEIVEYEPWMGDGGTYTLEDAKLHPEWFLSKEEIKEIEDVKQEAIRKEREEIDAKLAAEAAAAEKKAKKKEKKKKKKEEEEAKLAAKEAAEAASKASAVANEEPIDEVTAAAMTISQGIDNEELLLDDDMFDFENEDITDLF